MTPDHVPTVDEVMADAALGCDRYGCFIDAALIELDGDTLRQVLEHHYDPADPNWQTFVTVDDFDRPDFDCDP